MSAVQLTATVAAGGTTGVPTFPADNGCRSNSRRRRLSRRPPSCSGSLRRRWPCPTRLPSRAAVMKARLAALDTCRGITIVGMILVNHPGTCSALYTPFQHTAYLRHAAPTLRLFGRGPPHHRRPATPPFRPLALPYTPPYLASLSGRAFDVPTFPVFIQGWRGHQILDPSPYGRIIQ